MILFVKPKERTQRIGGTDIAAILGVSEYKSRDKLKGEKSGRLSDDFKGNNFTESGLMYEDAVRKWYEKTSGEHVMDPVAEAENDLLPGHTFVHPEHDFLVGSPDGLVRLNSRYKVSPHPDGLVVSGIKWGWEAKVTHYFGKRKWDGLEKKMPENYWLQCQYYMMLTGLKRWDLSVHHLTTADRETHVIEADCFAHEEILEACIEFWKEVEDERKEIAAANA